MNEMIITLVSTNGDEVPFTKVVRIEFDTYPHMVEALGALTNGQDVVESQEMRS
jgi:hypothetical protein